MCYHWNIHISCLLKALEPEHDNIKTMKGQTQKQLHKHKYKLM